MPDRRTCLGAVLLSCLLVPHTAGADAPSFPNQVAPLLQARCLSCHGGPRAKGGLDLSTRDKLLAGGSTGKVVVPGKSADSLLYTHVRDSRMPPRDPLTASDAKLLKDWIDAGAAWEGPALVVVKPDERRAGKDWWSLQPIRRPEPPKVEKAAWVRTPIDAFILARLEKEKLRPSKEAERGVWLRRVTLDLTGLLPTPEQADAFGKDTSADAYEKVVDRLLASSAYGERWGRHWLDVVRFAESYGYEQNGLRQNAWPYRDYVIKAFNEDRPFHRFVREQLAGEVAGKGDFLGEAATGFLVGGPHDTVINNTKEGQLQQRADDLFDMVSNTGATFLGLTVGCARCHDHKFDPISQKDFYGLQAVFAGVVHADRVIATTDPGTRKREAEQVKAELRKLTQRLDDMEPEAGGTGATPNRPPVNPRRNVERISPADTRYLRFTIAATTDGTEPCIDELEVYTPDPKVGNIAPASRGTKVTASSAFPSDVRHKLGHVNDGLTGNDKSWISNEKGQGTLIFEWTRVVKVERIVWGRDRGGIYGDRLAKDYRVEVSTDGRTWTPVAGSWDRVASAKDLAPPTEAVQKLHDQRRTLEERLVSLEKPPSAYAGTFRTPDRVHVLKRGDPMQPLEAVEPGAIVAVTPAFSLKPSATESQRRLALADWIASKDNPLPARVMVNRVWHWHFGQGLVRTPSDFGYNGDRPSHPDLLDWLAAEYQKGGGKLKPLHKLIVLSNTYRQASARDEEAAKVDGDNRLLWRYSPRRLEAEAIRDTMLQVSGALNPRAGGPGYHLWDYSGYVVAFTPRQRLGEEEFRRMVYQFKPRLQQDQTFGAFDCPDATQSTPKRTTSTTPIQALNLLNDPFVHDQAERFAARVAKEVGDDAAKQVSRAFRLALGREPSEKEAATGQALVKRHGLSPLCRALFNANEFVFVD